MLKRSMIIAAMAWTLSAHAAQTATSGSIIAMRTHSDAWAVSTLAGVSILQLSTPFVNGCAWLYVPADDRNMLSVVLASKLSGQSVTIWYDSTVTSPWGDPTTCLAQAIQQ